MKYVLFECFPFYFLSFLWIYFDTREACCFLSTKMKRSISKTVWESKEKKTNILNRILSGRFFFSSFEKVSFIFHRFVGEREHIFMYLLCHWDSFASTFGAILLLLVSYIFMCLNAVNTHRNLISSNVYHVCVWVSLGFFFYMHTSKHFCQRWITFSRIRWEFMLNRE